MPHLGSTQLRDLGHPHASPDTSDGPQGGASHAGSLAGAIIREAPGWVLFTLLISPQRTEPVSTSGSYLRAPLCPHPHSSSPFVATVLLGPHGLLPSLVSCSRVAMGPTPESASLLVAGGVVLTCLWSPLPLCCEHPVPTQVLLWLTDRAPLTICLSSAPIPPQEGLCCGVKTARDSQWLPQCLQRELGRMSWHQTAEDTLRSGIQEGRHWLPWSSAMLKPSSPITESQRNGVPDPPCVTVKSTDFPVPCPVT